MPRQLHTIDRLFLEMDTPENCMGVTPIYFYDPSGLPDGKFDFDLIMNHLDRCVRSISVLCGQLHRTPLDLDNPYLIEDKSFDINNHVKHISFKETDNIKELSEYITSYQEQPMNTSRPLWDAIIIDNINVKTLPKDCFMIAIKIHHAVADGMTLMDLTAKFHGQLSIGEPVKLPSNETLISGGILGTATRIVSNNIKQTLSLVNPLLKVAPQLSLNAINYAMGRILKTGTSGAKTRFGNQVSSKKSWGYATFEMKELSRIRKLFPSTTINDIVLTIVAGGLREYLDSKGELPLKAMRAMAPIDVRSPLEQGEAGNEISMMSLSLPVQIVDPLERLIEVVKYTSLEKESQAQIGSRNMSDLAKNLPAAYISYVSKVFGTATASSFISKLGNTVVTNVPGPKQELTLQGAKLVKFSGVGPVADGVGLLHAIMSYNGTLVLNAVSCKDMIPDMKFYIQCMQKSHDQLVESVNQRYESVVIGSEDKRVNA